MSVKGEAIIRVSRVEKSPEINKRACHIIRHLRIIEMLTLYNSPSSRPGFDWRNCPFWKNKNFFCLRLCQLTAEHSEVIPKVKQMISRLRISLCNSLSHFKLKVVDSLPFQAKYWHISSLLFLQRLFYPMTSWFRQENEFLFTLKNAFFLINPIL